MRTSIRKSLCLALTLVALISCGKGFLDEQPSQLPSGDQLKEAGKKSEDISLGFVNGVVSSFFKALQSTGGSHDDFAQKAFDISADLMSGDMEMRQSNYKWFQLPARLTSWQKDEINNYSVWRISYRTISLANGFFVTAGGDETVPGNSVAPETRFNWGQVKALRALAYLNLARFYGGPYSDATKSKPTVPVYKAADDASKPKGQSTLEQVYEQIVQDLKQAIEAIEGSGKSRPDRQYVDETVDRVALARAYMDLGKWDEAYDVANKVITDQAATYPLIPAKELLTNGFNDYQTPEFIWALDITKDNTGALLSFWGHVDVFTYGYAFVGARKAINKNISDQIPATDLRGDWFHPTMGVPWCKFFSASGKAAWEASGRQRYGVDRTWLSDIVFMRMSEVYLIASEAAARKGDDATSKTLLLTLLKQRTREGKYTEVETATNALSHDDLLKTLLYNWRVEMWGEGQSLAVMRRFKNNVERSVRNGFLSGTTIKWDDPRLVYEIPQHEASNNQLIR